MLMQSLIVTLSCFNTYLANAHSKALPKRMKYYKNRMSEFNRDFNTTHINDNDETKAIIASILKNLNIPRYKMGRYLNAPLTLYEFLVEVNAQTNKENEKLKEFLVLIKKQSRKKLEKIVISGLVGIALFQLSLPFIVHAEALAALQEITAAALFFPAVGIIFTAGVALYSLYKNLYDKKMTLYQRFKDNFFLLADSALKFAAYGVLLAAATTVSPVSAILFVAAECLSVLKEVVNLAHMIFFDKWKLTAAEARNIDLVLQHTRHQFDFIKRRDSLLINTALAIIMLGIVAAWCFVPGGIGVTIGAFAAIALVYLFKYAVHKYHDASIQKRLQQRFGEIEGEYERQQALQEGMQPEEDLVEDREETSDLDTKPLLISDAHLRDEPNAGLGRASELGIFAGRPNSGILSQNAALSPTTSLSL